MRFQVPREVNNEEDEDEEAPTEEESTELANESSNILPEGISNVSSTENSIILDQLLPSLSNLQLIYQSPREKTAKLKGILDSLRTSSCSPSDGRRRSDQCRLIRRLQQHDPLQGFDETRKKLAKANAESALKKLEQDEFQVSVAAQTKPDFGTSSQFRQSMERILNKQERQIQEITNQIIREEQERLQWVKQEMETSEREQFASVHKALEIVRKRDEADEKARQAELRRKQEEQERERNRQEEMKRQQEEAERKKREAEEKQNAAELAEQQAAARDLKQQQVKEAAITRNHGSERAIEEAKELLDKLKNAKENIDKQVKNNKAMFTEALRYRMVFTTKVGAVTNSRSHIMQFVNELSQILNNGKQVSALLYEWLLNNLAKQFVKQAESEVSVNLKKAFPLAILAAMLSSQHSDLMIFIRARLVKKCPTLIPQYPKRSEGESDDDLRIRMGYKRIEDKLESEHHYQERMFGMIAFFAAITQTNLAGSGVSNPLGIKHGWIYLSRLLNMTPRKITPGAIETFLRIAGHRLINTYGQQAHKLIRYIHQTYMPLIKSPGSEGAKVRLQLLLEEYAKFNQTFQPHEGLDLRP